MSSQWRKSSYSNQTGGACIEVATWRKSTHSNTSGGNCVETATAPNTVLVRDTTNRAALTLAVASAAWTTFVAKLK